MLAWELIVSKFAVVSDIHANLEALTAVLKVIDQEGIEDIVCLGDIIGYGADPVECLRLIREREVFCIQGNHDRQIAGEIDSQTRDFAVDALLWTREQLSEEDKQFLVGLDQTLTLGGCFQFCHGSPRHPDEYIMHVQGMKANLRFLRSDYPEVLVCFFGHTHLPSIIGGDLIVQELSEEKETFPLDKLATYLINPGGVGQPRDGCPEASFVIFDRAKWSVDFYRVEYDIASAQNKIMAAGLSQKLADRLSVGI